MQVATLRCKDANVRPFETLPFAEILDLLAKFGLVFSELEHSLFASCTNQGLQAHLYESDEGS